MKILVYSNMNTFIAPIVQQLQQDHVTVLSEKQSERDILNEILSFKPDVVWFEWANELVMNFSNFVTNYAWQNKKPRIICRLHSYELFTPFIKKIQWNVIDDIVFVSEHTKELFGYNTQNNPCKQHVIHNGVNTKQFLCSDKKKPKTIAWLGSMGFKKNTPLMLYCFEEIFKVDKDFTLHIAGRIEDPRTQLYITNYINNSPFKKKVYFYNHIKNTVGWLFDKQYIINTSLFEGCNVAILEAVASGCIPLIHAFWGSDTLYPKEWLFRSTAECAKLATVTYNYSMDLHAEAKINLEHINKHYTFEHQIKSIKELIESK